MVHRLSKNDIDHAVNVANDILDDEQLEICPYFSSDGILWIPSSKVGILNHYFGVVIDTAPDMGGLSNAVRIGGLKGFALRRKYKTRLRELRRREKYESSEKILNDINHKMKILTSGR